MKNILIQAYSYPVATPGEAFDHAASLATHFDARLSAALCQVRIPRVSNYLADKLVGANEAIAQENLRSKDQVLELVREFAKRVPDTMRGEQLLVDCTLATMGDRMATHARAFDLAILPLYEEFEHRDIAERLIFASGRPVLLLPGNNETRSASRIVIGWDRGRAAARALADALPFCRIAKQVEIVAVTGEKDFEEGPNLAAVRDHLAAHGIDATTVEIAAEGDDAGTTLLRHSADADLLVAGAYGHSRVREFILGGATRSMISDPQIPLLLSH